MKVWDAPLRLLHWTLVLAVAGAWFSTEGFSRWHQPTGWLALAAVLLRLLWSGFGSRYARFTHFLRSPRALLAYLRQVLQRREPRHIGHNPLGGWMIVALMSCVVGLALTGWLYTTDWLWGDETVDIAHQGLAWALVGLAAVHVAGVIFTSLRQRENLVRAMFSGDKRPPAPGDID